jgi:hypothetical protein
VNQFFRYKNKQKIRRISFRRRVIVERKNWRMKQKERETKLKIKLRRRG